MATDTIISCLRDVSDYAQFERFCTDVMARSGYVGIAPIGGSGDKGRDALHRCGVSGSITLFAYSTEAKWRAKLFKDANKIKKHDHECHVLAFATNARITSASADKAIKDVHADYGWRLELFGIERLRACVAANLDLIKLHPQLFPPTHCQHLLSGSEQAVAAEMAVHLSKVDSALAMLMSAPTRPSEVEVVTSRKLSNDFRDYFSDHKASLPPTLSGPMDHLWTLVKEVAYGRIAYLQDDPAVDRAHIAATSEAWRQYQTASRNAASALQTMVQEPHTWKDRRGLLRRLLGELRINTGNIESMIASANRSGSFERRSMSTAAIEAVQAHSALSDSLGVDECANLLNQLSILQSRSESGSLQELTCVSVAGALRQFIVRVESELTKTP